MSMYGDEHGAVDPIPIHRNHSCLHRGVGFVGDGYSTGVDDETVSCATTSWSGLHCSVAVGMRVELGFVLRTCGTESYW